MFNTEVTEEITAAAQKLGLEPAALLAVAEVESGGKAYTRIDGQLEPLIRFEGHYFDRRLTPLDRARARTEKLASPKAGAIPNSVTQAGRWRLLARATAIDPTAAYESVSWGLGQVMGAHWDWLGYDSVDALVAEARGSVTGQVRLMVRFIEKSGLMKALKAHDWSTFARGYNGPAFARYGYHEKLAAAHKRYASEASGSPKNRTPVLKIGSKGEAVRQLQRLLGSIGYRLAADGDFGPATARAVTQLQKQQGLEPDGVVGEATWEALALSEATARQKRQHLRTMPGLAAFGTTPETR